MCPCYILLLVLLCIMHVLLFFIYKFITKVEEKKNSFFVPAGLWFALRLSLLCVPELYMLSRHPRPAPAMSRSYGTASEAREKNTPSALSIKR